MKIVEFVDCDVIQDLLPSYSDKISSESTNKLIEKHLQRCEKCRVILNEMNNENFSQSIENQKEQIDYLKKYKKILISRIYLTIVSTICILLCSYLFLYYAEFFVDINDIDVRTVRNLCRG